MFVQKKLIKKLSAVNIIALFLVILSPFLFFSEKAQAAGFTQAYLRLDRLKASTATGGLVCADPVTSATEIDVQVTFPTDFGVNTTAGNWDVNTDNLPSGATAWPGIGTEATGVSGQTVTFSSTELTHTGTVLYCFNFVSTNTLTNHATPANSYTGTITTRASGASTIDSTGYAVSIISNDQIVISATVPSTFSVAFGDGGDPDSDPNTDSFNGNLSTTTASTYGNTLTITTNAGAGWVAWVKSTNAALNSASTGGTIATAGTVNNDDTDLAADVTSGYVLDVNITTQGSGGTGTVTQAANYGQEYDGLNSTSGGTLATTFQPIAASDGTTDGDVLTLIERARITAVQAAATDYTDTLTVVAAGRF